MINNKAEKYSKLREIIWNTKNRSAINRDKLLNDSKKMKHDEKILKNGKSIRIDRRVNLFFFCIVFGFKKRETDDEVELSV